MDFYLVTPTGTEYNVRYDGSGYFTFTEELPVGVGYSAVDHLATLSAYRDGGQLNAIRYRPRVIDLTIVEYASAIDTTMTALKRIYTAAKPDVTGLVPSKIKAVANSKTAYLDVYYTGEIVRQEMRGRYVEVTLRFIAYNPQWYYSTQNSVSLTLNGTVNLPHIARRSAGANAITWDSMGGGANNTVWCLAVAPNGDIYAGGLFTQISGVSANYIARWNGSSWSALGSGMNNYVYSIAIASNGDVYAGGNFTTAGGVTVNRIARWNGSSWSALGSGMNGSVNAIAIASNGDVYAGGDFTTAGGVTVNRIARWNGSSWSALGSGINNTVSSIVIAPNGDIYAGGNFTTAGGLTANRVAVWNGSAWSALGSGMNDYVYCLSIAQNGNILVGGIFTIAGNMTVNDRIALWNGYRWLSIDLDISGTPAVYSILPQQLIIGHNNSGTSSISAYSTQITNNGSPIKPLIEVNGRCTLQSIFNETTGKRLWFNITLQAGEKLTIDCEKLTITSSWRGNMLSALVPGSNFADFTLESGNNNITVFAINTSGASAFIKWYNRYDTLAEAIG